MKKILCLMTTVICLGLSAMAVAGHAQSQASWLMVMHAESAKVVPCNAKTCLSLQGVDKNIVAFTDRPVRKYHSIPTDQFINSWDKTFKSSAPNAAVLHAEITSVDGNSITPAIVTLENPQLKGNHLIFEIVMLNHDSSFVAGKTYQDVNVFIDCAIAAARLF